MYDKNKYILQHLNRNIMKNVVEYSTRLYIYIYIYILIYGGITLY